MRKTVIPILIGSVFFSFAFVLYRYDDAITRVVAESTPLTLTIFVSGLAGWAVIIAIDVRRRRSERRKARIAACQCIDCGYDLRATRDRRPECGAAPAVTGSPRHDDSKPQNDRRSVHEVPFGSEE